MITAAAFCPHPPLLIPAVAAGAAGELDDLRSACDAAIRDVIASSPDRIVLVGPGPVTGRLADDAVGTLAPFGIDLRVEPPGGCGGTTSTGPTLPLSLTIGSWLLARAGWQGPVSHLALAPGVAAQLLQDEASALAGCAERTGLLVMADASSTRTEKAPGSWQPGALAFDARVGAALGSGDPARVADLDLGTAQEVGAQGWAAWRAAAIATAATSWRARLYYQGAPYGVGYLVASWT